MHIICTENDIGNWTQIRIKKRCMVSEDISIFPIVFNNDPLLIQTPCATLAYQYMLFDNKYFQMDLSINDTLFINMIQKLVSFLLENKALQQFISTLFLKNNIQLLSPSLIKLRLQNDNVDSIQVFNASRERILLNNISKFDQIYAIFQVDKFVICKTNMYFTFKVVQIKKLWLSSGDLANNKCMIIEFDDTKYKKMLSIGISIDAVEHKMKMDNIPSSHILDFMKQPGQQSRKMLIPPPPPPPPPKLPPPPPPPMLPPSNLMKMAFLGDIKNQNFKLKKIVVSEYEKNENFKPPSLKDILSAKDRLKKLK
jgi:hypothetical protein